MYMHECHLYTKGDSSGGMADGENSVGRFVGRILETPGKILDACLKRLGKILVEKNYAPFAHLILIQSQSKPLRLKIFKFQLKPILWT